MVASELKSCSFIYIKNDLKKIFWLKVGCLWNFKFHCKYIDPLNKSLFATTVV